MRLWLLLILSIFLISLSSLVSAEWCYQETANVSTACGGLATGAYWIPPTGYPNSDQNAYIDGDYDTFWAAGGNYSFVFNYTVPARAQDSSQWQIKHSICAQFGKNFTSAACFQQSVFQGNLTVRKYNDTPGIGTVLNYTCWGGSEWEPLAFCEGNILWEESMWWNLTDITPPNWVTIPPNQTIEYLIDAVFVDFDATDIETSVSSYSVNDSRFSIDLSGLLTNTTLLGTGNYHLNISVNDTEGNNNYTIYNFTINKTDNYPCNLTFNDTTIVFPQDFTVATDCTTPFVLSRNNTPIANNSVQSLAVGDYFFNVSRNDTKNYTLYEQTRVITVTPDTFNPLLTVISPLQGQIFKGGNPNHLLVPLTLNASDDFLDACNYSLYYRDSMLLRISTVANCTGTVVMDIPEESYLINIEARDLSNNTNTTQINFSAQKISDQGGGTPIGGGPGGPIITEPSVNVTEEIEDLLICGNNKCQEGENPLNCAQDCPFNADELFCLVGTEECAAWVFNLMILIIIGTILWVAFKKERKDRKR